MTLMEKDTLTDTFLGVYFFNAKTEGLFTRNCIQRKLNQFENYFENNRRLGDFCIPDLLLFK